jgi:hypothetical protein
MASTNTLLRVMYGSTTLPTAKLEGSMYVLTSATASNGIYSAGLYFDLDSKRYQINSTEADHVGHTAAIQLNGVALGSSYDGHENVTWNIPLAGAASTTAAGLVSNAAQTFYGAKTFNAAVTFSNTIAVKNTATMRAILPEATTTYDIGSTSKKWSNVYASTFHGDLDGNATSATSADYVGHNLNIKDINSNTTKTYNGSDTVEVTLTDLVGAGNTIPVALIPPAALERIVTYASQEAAQTALTNGDIQAGDMVHITGNGIMYYVKESTSGGTTTTTLEEFTAGVAAKAAQTVGLLTMQIGGTNVTTFDGHENTTFNVPFATDSAAGVVSTAAQTFAGNKTFKNNVIINGTLTANSTIAVKNTATMRSIIPEATETYTLGSSDKKWSNVYATTFTGDLVGTANKANETTGSITFSSATLANATGITGSSFNGSGNVTVGVFKPAAASAGGSTGLVPAPASGDVAKVLRSNGYWASLTGTNGINIVTTANDAFSIGHSNSVTSATIGPNDGATINVAAGGSFTIPNFTYDTYGHVTSGTTRTVTINALTVTQHLTEGLKVATVGSTDIYSGVMWETF